MALNKNLQFLIVYLFGKFLPHDLSQFCGYYSFKNMLILVDLSEVINFSNFFLVSNNGSIRG